MAANDCAFSVKCGQAKGENRTRQSSLIKAKGATDRRVKRIYQLGVDPNIPRVPGIIITAAEEFFRVSVGAKDIRSGPIKFEPLLHNHVRELNIKAKVSNGAHRQFSGRNEIVELPGVSLALKPKPCCFMPAAAESN